MAAAEPVDAVPVAATDPLYVLYTSGTTGKPKGVVRDNGGHAVALRWSMEAIYDTGPGEVFWAASDVGWVVGHSYIVYAPLLAGATTVLYEGKPVGTPDPGAFWRVVAEHGVTTLFTAPTALRAIRKEDPEAAHLARYDLSSLRALFLAGERLDPDTYHWAKRDPRRPAGRRPLVADGDRLADRRELPGHRAAAGEGRLADAAGARATTCASSTATATSVAPGETGAIAIRLPLPPGTLPTLWGDDERFVSSYLTTHPGHYVTGDGGSFDEDGYLFVMGRIDDVINVAGHRLSTGEMEEIVAGAPRRRRVRGDRRPGRAARASCRSGSSSSRTAPDRDPRGARGRARRARAAGDRRGRVLPHGARRRAACRRRAPGRSCARRCARSPTGGDPPVPSTIEDPAVLDELTPVVRREV